MPGTPASSDPLLARRRVMVLALAATLLGVYLAVGGVHPADAALRTSVTTRANGWSVTLRVQRTTIRVGHPVDATLVIVNRTGRPQEAFSCSANSVYAVTLENRRVPNSPVTGAVACTSMLRPGRNVFHRKVLTDYVSFRPADPPRAAPLPPGLYVTVVNWPRFSGSPPRPGILDLRLTR